MQESRMLSQAEIDGRLARHRMDHVDSPGVEGRAAHTGGRRAGPASKPELLRVVSAELADCLDRITGGVEKLRDLETEIAEAGALLGHIQRELQAIQRSESGDPKHDGSA